MVSGHQSGTFNVAASDQPNGCYYATDSGAERIKFNTPLGARVERVQILDHCVSRLVLERVRRVVVLDQHLPSCNRLLPDASKFGIPK